MARVSVWLAGPIEDPRPFQGASPSTGRQGREAMRRGTIELLGGPEPRKALGKVIQIGQILVSAGSFLVRLEVCQGYQ